jgi:hypothetical protein
MSEHVRPEFGRANKRSFVTYVIGNISTYWNIQKRSKAMSKMERAAMDWTEESPRVVTTETVYKTQGNPYPARTQQAWGRRAIAEGFLLRRQQQAQLPERKASR